MALITGQPEDIDTTNELDRLKLPPSEGGASPLQIPAIESTFVKFTGTSGELLDNPPEQDEARTYVVRAICTGYDIRTRADGERRVVAVMDIESCYEQGRVPIVDENQPGLFDHGDEDGDDDE